MDNDTNSRPWMRSGAIIKQIKANIDHETIDKFSKEVINDASDSRRRLKGIYFDADIAAALELLKKKRVNISGYVNDAVRSWLEKNRQD